MSLDDTVRDACHRKCLGNTDRNQDLFVREYNSHFSMKSKISKIKNIYNKNGSGSPIFSASF